MEDITLIINNTTVTTSVPPSFPADFKALLSNFKPFQEYIINLDHQAVLTHIEFQSVDLFGKRIGFLKFKASITIDGKPVPGIVFMRGGSIAVLIIVNEIYCLLTNQFRTPVGKYLLETPAGMLDGDCNFSGVAAKEIQEECGVSLKQSDLKSLGEVFMSPGGCDEVIQLFSANIQLDDQQLNTILSQVHGEGEHEHITCQLVKIQDAYNLNDAKLLSCLARYYK